jgi:hypothetical protein
MLAQKWVSSGDILVATSRGCRQRCVLMAERESQHLPFLAALV